MNKDPRQLQHALNHHWHQLYIDGDQIDMLRADIYYNPSTRMYDLEYLTSQRDIIRKSFVTYDEDNRRFFFTSEKHLT